MLKKLEMWALLLAALLFASPTLAWCQTADSLDAQPIVHRALVQIAKGAYNAENEKQVRRLGDAASVAFTKEIGDRQVKWTDIETLVPGPRGFCHARGNPEPA